MKGRKHLRLGAAAATHGGEPDLVSGDCSLFHEADVFTFQAARTVMGDGTGEVGTQLIRIACKSLKDYIIMF